MLVVGFLKVEIEEVKIKYANMYKDYKFWREVMENLGMDRTIERALHSETVGGKFLTELPCCLLVQGAV